ncbi:ABC transporter substrate-binding protein [Actinomadura rifamycini]|uniref:ABC transporter substrate-binding protein n=1 Tax=Actinomadura rifamycini TaxID=31962 RepID=UPI00047ED723|nr:ABC transporter substrate-binding protein [Actinomadura rifamycini]
MKRKVRITAAAALALVLPLGVTACSGKATGGSGGTDADGVKVGTGVTDDVIKIGVETDLTGVYAPLGKSLTQAQQLYVEEVNKAGGVCGRDLELVVRDHGYDVQKAVSAYSELQGEVIGMPQFIGSPMVTALKQRIETDKMFILPNAWSTTLLGSKYIQVTGTTYDVDMINGVSWLVEEGMVEKGDKVGHVYFEGDYGESALNGSKAAAEKYGLELVEQKIKATATDMTAQASALESADVKAILMSAGPRQSASLAGIVRSRGVAAPIVASNSGFSPQLLETEAAPALLKGFYLTSAGAPIGSDLPAVKKLADAYGKKYPGQPLDNAVVNGYTNAVIFVDALKEACEAKDLTRDGVINAHRARKSYDTGYGTPMDFSTWTEPATRKTYILRTDKEALGGLVVEREAAASETATGYEVPVGK